MALCFCLITTAQNLDVQNENSTHFFAQGMLTISQEAMTELELDMRTNNPYLKVIRLDVYTNRFFLLTENITSLEIQDLLSWFGEFADSVSCVQIGLHGVDTVNPFPFTNCN